MDVQADARGASAAGGDSLVWVRHCACGRIRGLFAHAAAASQPAVVSACDNCGRYECEVSPARSSGGLIGLRVCSRCAAIVYEPPVASDAATCRRCRRGTLVERAFEPPARLTEPGRL